MAPLPQVSSRPHAPPAKVGATATEPNAADSAPPCSISAGISVISTAPVASQPWSPIAVALGPLPFVPASTLQFGEPNVVQSSGEQAANDSGLPVCTLDETWVSAKETIVRQALEERDPIQALNILNRAYAKSEPGVQKLIRE